MTALLTQGRGDGQEWVTSFKVSYSKDGESWSYITTDSESDSARVCILMLSMLCETKIHIVITYDCGNIGRKSYVILKHEKTIYKKIVTKILVMYMQEGWHPGPWYMENIINSDKWHDWNTQLYILAANQPSDRCRTILRAVCDNLSEPELHRVKFPL